MTDKQLKRLKKIELLEIMIAQDREIEDLRARLAEAERRLQISDVIIKRYLILKSEAKAAKPSEPGPTGKSETTGQDR